MWRQVDLFGERAVVLNTGKNDVFVFQADTRPSQWILLLTVCVDINLIPY